MDYVTVLRDFSLLYYFENLAVLFILRWNIGTYECIGRNAMRFVPQ